jgi:hypothetical protein
VGTFTAQTMTRYIDEHKDTTEQYANYSYWADERRAVITADAPHEKGIAIYMVDLDHDVAVAAYNEGHSYVIPRLYIGTLEQVGITDVMGGIDLALEPTEHTQEILGQKCRMYRISTYNHGVLWIPPHDVPNPVLDMARWMGPRYIQARHEKHFREVLMFGVKGHPMPFAIQGTYLTSFKPGKVPPPEMDLSNYRVLDERFRDFEKERQEYEREKARQQVITIDNWDDVVVPVDEGDSTPKETEPVIEEAPMEVPPPPVVPR